MYSAPDVVFNPIKTTHTRVNTPVGLRGNGIRLFVNEPGVISLQLHTEGPTDTEGAGKSVACFSHAELSVQDVDWLIAELVRLRTGGYDATDEEKKKFLDERATGYPFRVVTDKRGPNPSRLSARDYGPIVFAGLRGNTYRVYLFKSEECARRFKRDYRGYVRND